MRIFPQILPTINVVKRPKVRIRKVRKITRKR
jgi:hypothetical protein